MLPAVDRLPKARRAPTARRGWVSLSLVIVVVLIAAGVAAKGWFFTDSATGSELLPRLDQATADWRAKTRAVVSRAEVSPLFR